MRRLVEIAFPLGLVALLVFGFITNDETGIHPDERIEAYCAYDARSLRQFDACVEHVTLGDIKRSAGSRAALCSRDGGAACDDAGPVFQAWYEAGRTERCDPWRGC